MGARRLYKFATPYNADELVNVSFEQMVDVVYMVSLYRDPQKLTRYAHNDWVFAQVTFGPVVSPPSAPTVTATTPNTTGYVAEVYQYVVTVISNTDPVQESRASAAGSVTNDLSLDGNKNTITITAHPDAMRYVIYKYAAGGYGYIGSTDGLSFVDDNIIPAMSNSPPRAANPFAGERDKPSSITFHGQRMILGRTLNNPNLVAGSRVGDFDNFDSAYPIKADDAFAHRVVARRVNAVNQLVSANKGLLALTTDSIFSITGGGDKPITPIDYYPVRESGRGVTRLRAIDIDEVIFVQPVQGSSVRALGYTYEIDGIQSNDVTVFSRHFFKSDVIIAWAHQIEPYACIWAVMQSGALLCFTWEREQQVWGWTKCETDGFFEDVASIEEGGVDRVYVIVRREIDGVTVRNVERMALPSTDYATNCHLDFSVTTVANETQYEVVNCWHLAGEDVRLVFDGYEKDVTVDALGRVDVPEGFKTAHVGLPYQCKFRTLPLAISTPQGTKFADVSNCSQVSLLTSGTRGIVAGITGTELEPVPTWDDGDDVTKLPDMTNQMSTIPVQGSWEERLTLTVEQNSSFPCHITGVLPKIVMLPDQ